MMNNIVDASLIRVWVFDHATEVLMKVDDATGFNTLHHYVSEGGLPLCRDCLSIGFWGDIASVGEKYGIIGNSVKTFYIVYELNKAYRVNTYHKCRPSRVEQVVGVGELMNTVQHFSVELSNLGTDSSVLPQEILNYLHIENAPDWPTDYLEAVEWSTDSGGCGCGDCGCSTEEAECGCEYCYCSDEMADEYPVNMDNVWSVAEDLLLLADGCGEDDFVCTIYSDEIGYEDTVIGGVGIGETVSDMIAMVYTGQEVNVII